MKEQIYKIRAHHGLCLCFFQGRGYSESFVKNMAAIKEMLEQNPLVCITSQTDIICEKCPNNTDGTCKSEAAVAEYDRQVLLRCNIPSGDCMPYQDFEKMVQKNILMPGKRKEICAGCQWEELCDSRNMLQED